MHKMIRTSLAATLASILTIALSPAAEVYAASSTWVSQTGNNTNNCTSPATPCASIAGATGALAKTSEGGVVHVLPGNYGTFTIDKAIEIIADGGQASIITAIAFPGGGEAAKILVNAGPDDDVRISGFVLDGGTLAGHGVAFLAGGALHLEDCALVKAGGPNGDFGVVFRPTGASEFYVSNCAISGNGSASTGGGIQVRPTGSGSAKAVLDNVNVEDNTTGILIDGRTTTGSNTVTIRDSTFAGGATQGINAIDSGGGTTGVMIEGSTVSNNGSQGVVANGANVIVRVRDSTVTGNGRGVQAATGAQIISHGGNVVAGNTVNGAFSSSLGQQ